MLHSGFRRQEVPSFTKENLAQVDRVASSPLFHGSEALSKLLRYLADRTLNSPADHLKEYQIATEVLGRPPDFDPQTDACVRVQVARLRSKLAEYYESVGGSDPVIIHLPKGGYALSFEQRPVDDPSGATAVSAKTSRRFILQPRVLAILCLVAVSSSLLTAVLISAFGKPNKHADLRSDATSPAMMIFWAPFLHDQDGPYIVYSNAAFVGSPMTGLRYFDPARDQQSAVSEHYTGVGEVMGAVRLGILFDQFGRQFRLKRSGLFTLDEAAHRNLIFLGSPTENPPLGKILSTHEFVFGMLPADPQHRSGVLSLHPRAGEQADFPSSPMWNGEDYAIIALAPGLDPSRRVLTLEGTSTLTTQAAAEFVCDPSQLADLVGKLGATSKDPLPTFEAVIRVRVEGDVPLESHLVALRKTQ